MNTKPLQLNAFINSVGTEKFEDYSKLAGTKVQNEDEFERMKTHLKNHYEGVKAGSTFTDSSGHAWDCVEIKSQPGLKGTDKTIATPPVLPVLKSASETKSTANTVKSFISEKKTDPHGNVMACPDGYIPLRRVTLKEMTRFKNLEHFFKKGSSRGYNSPTQQAAPAIAAEAPSEIHKYAHAYQQVANVGGHSFMSIYKPLITGNQVFSLSQHWYVAGNGPTTQTAEVGLQVFPGMYQTDMPCLFIYWTADNYQTTGNYNLDKAAFVQVSPAWAIGGPLTNVSTVGGAQNELEVSFTLYQGNWWLYIGGQAVGYYPVALYNNGGLATGATSIDYGGEVVGSDSWPQMGSGQFANAGAGNAAYHRNIYYYPGDGTAQWATLIPSQDSPLCFTINVENSANPGTYFYFGGPGGSRCEPSA